MWFLSHGSKARPSLRRGFVPTEEPCLDRDESDDSDVALARRARGTVLLFLAYSYLLK